MITHEQLYNLGLFGKLALSNNETITRVPGGWVYGDMHGNCFIPYSDDMLHGPYTDFIKVVDAVNESFKNDCSSIGRFKIVLESDCDFSNMRRQECDIEMFDHEYVDQSSSYQCNDCFSGSVYYPLGYGQYLQVEFSS